MNLSIKDITKRFGSQIALDSVSLDIGSNKIVVLVGANGSGKTTLLRLLAGLEQPDNGSIIVDNLKKSTDELQQIATLVFQKTTMFNRSVFSNLEFGLRIRRIKKEEIKRRIADGLKVVGLEGFENRNAKKLSGGEQQRIALVRAFLLEPKILLLDEPTANLDINSVRIIEKVIIEQKNSKTIILLSTHNLRQAKRLGDEIAHIHKGRIITQGSPRVFFAKPKIFFE